MYFIIKIIDYFKDRNKHFNNFENLSIFRKVLVIFQCQRTKLLDPVDKKALQMLHSCFVSCMLENFFAYFVAVRGWEMSLTRS